MIKLLLDSSTPFLYVSLIKDDKEMWSYLEKGNNDHSEKLTTLLKNMFEQQNLQVSDINQIIVSKGPGSYTGIRVSMTIAKMFSWAKNIPLYTFSTLDLLLSKFKNKDGLYVSKIDARRGNSFVKVVEIKKGVWVTHLEDVFMPNPELDQLIQSQYARAIIFNEIKEDNFNSVDFLKSNVIHRVEDVYGLVPSYLRSGI